MDAQIQPPDAEKASPSVVVDYTDSAVSEELETDWTNRGYWVGKYKVESEIWTSLLNFRTILELFYGSDAVQFEDKWVRWDGVTSIYAHVPVKLPDTKTRH